MQHLLLGSCQRLQGHAPILYRSGPLWALPSGLDVPRRPAAENTRDTVTVMYVYVIAPDRSWSQRKRKEAGCLVCLTDAKRMLRG